MDPGERFTLTRSIYATLTTSDWDWRLVDAVLSEFGAEEFDYSDFHRLILERVRSLSDDRLIALNSHVHPDESDAGVGQDHRGEGPWADDTFRLFISHTHAHQALAGNVRDTLGQWRVECFVAHTTIDPTEEWIDVIERALRTCDALVALMTEDFSASRWCDQEVGVAYGLAKLVVPVRMPAVPYGFIGRYQALGFNREREYPYHLATRLFELLADHARTRSRMIDPVVDRFAKSGSFDGTRAAWPALKALPREAWTEERVARVRQRLETTLRSYTPTSMMGAGASGRALPTFLNATYAPSASRTTPGPGRRRTTGSPSDGTNPDRPTAGAARRLPAASFPNRVNSMTANP
jgi:hypothetical protein